MRRDAARPVRLDGHERLRVGERRERGASIDDERSRGRTDRGRRIRRLASQTAQDAAQSAPFEPCLVARGLAGARRRAAVTREHRYLPEFQGAAVTERQLGPRALEGAHSVAGRQRGARARRQPGFILGRPVFHPAGHLGDPRIWRTPGRYAQDLLPG